ncbi:MAG: family 10 glycosylhydrolase, partial [Armatimonadota bacterium]
MSRVIFAAAVAWAVSSASGDDNLVANPSAEQAAENGRPLGWGVYIGAGSATLTVATEEKHSGQASACLELTKWYTPPEAEDTAANHTINVGIVLADNDFYRAQGALVAVPGTTYVFSFWYKGDLKSGAVRAAGWPEPDSDHNSRVAVRVTGGILRPGDEWQRATGTLRLPEGVTRFALMIHAGGSEKEGYTLGRLYVDDAEIKARAYPDGELRAVWWGSVKAADRDAGLKEIEESLDTLKRAGFNTIFASASSLYIAALNRPELRADEPRAAWDAFGEVLKAASARGMQVHAWFSPWIYKHKYRAVELRDHPEWAAVNSEGVANDGAVCFIRPEVRQFEITLVTRIIERYPDLAGIHVEEPGHPWGD